MMETRQQRIRREIEAGTYNPPPDAVDAVVSGLMRDLERCEHAADSLSAGRDCGACPERERCDDGYWGSRCPYRDMDGEAIGWLNWLLVGVLVVLTGLVGLGVIACCRRL